MAHLLRDLGRRQAEAQDARRPAGPAPAARHDDHAELHDPARLPAVSRHGRAAPHRPSGRAVQARPAEPLWRDPALRHAGTGALVRIRAGLRAAHGQCLGRRRLDHDGWLLPARSDDSPRPGGRPSRLDARLPALQGSPAPLAHESQDGREERAAAGRPEHRVLPAGHGAVRPAHALFVSPAGPHRPADARVRRPREIRPLERHARNLRIPGGMVPERDCVRKELARRRRRQRLRRDDRHEHQGLPLRSVDLQR